MKNTRTVRQFLFQFLVLPFFPFLQWLGRVTGVARHAKTLEGAHKRQPFLLGHLKPGVRLEEAEALLKANGFFMHRAAYPDPGQVLSMRRLDDANPKRQYHLRIFSDSEVRGHYEWTPEDNFWKHMNEDVRDARREEYMKWLMPLLEERSSG